jgi:hypothetical protein
MIRALAVAALIAIAAPAQALTIANDPGGLISDYLGRWATVAKSREEVRIDGDCHSACTLVLGIVPRERICVTAQARFGFHRASELEPNGRRHDSPEGTAELMAVYPPFVRAWLARHGGLTRQLKFMSAAASGLRRCK